MLDMDGRLRLAAALDRIIYGDPETFDRADALVVRDLCRGVAREWFVQFSMDREQRGPGLEGHAAGIGNVQMEGERREPWSSEAKRGIRAGQWKVVRAWASGRAREGFVIRQMADNPDPAEERAALLVFWQGEPEKLMFQEAVTWDLWFFQLCSLRFRPWKAVRTPDLVPEAPVFP